MEKSNPVFFREAASDSLLPMWTNPSGEKYYKNDTSIRFTATKEHEGVWTCGASPWPTRKIQVWYDRMTDTGMIE